MRHGSLFSGIGGFDLAAEWMGWENVFHCEWMPFPRQVLHHYWPNAISYEDITKTDFTIHRGEIDILTGGFPCQPYSSAGKRLGKDDERHLWPEMLRAIREIEPTYILGENVRGLTNWNGGVVFEEVCTDLESCGYEVQPLLLPAAAINAPHKRERIFFVAYSNSFTNNNKSNSGGDSKIIEPRRQKDKRIFSRITDGTYSKRNDASDTCNERLQRDKLFQSLGREEWNGDESHSSASKFHQIPNWEQFPTQSPVCGRDDGIPRKLDGITFPKWRNESIRGYGNAVVPQLVLRIFKTIQTYEQNSNARISG